MLRSRTCLNYLHRLGFVVKRPKKRLLKANAEKREAFVAAMPAAQGSAGPRGEDLLRGRSALPGGRRTADEMGAARRTSVGGHDQSPGLARRRPTTRRSAWRRARWRRCRCLATRTRETSVAFLKQLRAKHRGSLDRDLGQRPGPSRARRCATYSDDPDLNLRLVALPATARTSIRMRPSGTGYREDSHGQSLLRHDGQGTRESGCLLCRAG